MDAIAADLRQYLQQGRDGVLRALDGLSEHDARRPLVPSGTNVLGLVKHLVGIEQGYLVTCLGREAPLLPWDADGSVWENGDMWALPTESRDELVGLYRNAWLLADATLADVPLDSPATVPWWPEERRVTTFGHLVVRVVAETAQHAGHADILRETVDGRGGRDHDGMGDTAWWDGYVGKIQAAADTFR